MKYLRFLILSALLVTGAYVLQVKAAETHPSGKPVQGTLRTDNPITVADGENYWFQLGGAPGNTQVRLWADNGDGKGFQDYGIIGTTRPSNSAYTLIGELTLQKTLNCNSYEYLEPGKLLSVGNRDLFMKFYVEYVGQNKVSNVSWSMHDCSQVPTSQSTGSLLFPYTLENIYGRNHIKKPFPDSYPSGMAAPLVKFAGRYFDGDDRGGINMGLGFEWYHVYGSATNVGGNNNVKVVGNRIYIPLGSTIAAYNKDTFISRLANKTNSSLALFAGTREKNGKALNLQYDLAILPWDAYVYPENPDNAWLREFCDCHTGITWSEVDDRGYIYFNDRFGFGIARDDGSALRIIVQIREIEGLSGGPFGDGPPPTLPWLRTGKNGTVKLTDLNGYGRPNSSDYDKVNIIKTGSKYYAVFTGASSGGTGGTRVLDVTDPNNPQFLRSNPDEYISDLVQSGETVAAMTKLASGGGFAQTYSEIRIYNAADFIAGTAPKKVFSAGPAVGEPAHAKSPGYAGLAVDKISGKFYSIHYSLSPRPKSSIPSYVLPTASMAIFTPSGGTYTEQRYVLGTETMGGKSGNPGWNGYQYIYSVKGLHYNNGYLVARGQSPEGPGDVKIWIFKDGKPEELGTRGFIREYYGSGLGDIYQASVHALGGKDYLFISGFYVADVYELTGSSDIPTDPLIPINPTSTPTSTLPTVPPLDPDIFKKSCAELYAGKPALISLCNQVNFIQSRSCSMVPGLPFCKENLDAYMNQ